MATAIDELTRAWQLSGEAAAAAARLRESVVVVRGLRRGSGSGVVWNDRGLIITNHHVAPGGRAEVLRAGGPALAARVVSHSESFDLAALQLEDVGAASALTPAPIRDLGDPRVGEVVFAVGSPLGERNAVTLGIIGGVGPAPWLGRTGDVIQAAITLRPGNSGGALADVQGRVVGIPHMVVGGGLALAVPSRVVQRFLLGEGIAPGRFGVVGQWVELPAPVRGRYGLPAAAGLLLLEVLAGSPADEAGLMLGDIVVGTAAAGPSDDGVHSLARLSRSAAGEPIRVAVLRGSALHWFEVTPR